LGRLLGAPIPDHLHLRWPWFHRRALRTHIGSCQDLTLERLKSVKNPSYYDGSIGLRRLISTMIALPLIGLVASAVLRHFVMLETLSVRSGRAVLSHHPIENAEIRAVLDYWLLQIGPEKWFVRDDTLDDDICARFSALHIRATTGALAPWRGTPRGCLAEIILLDQFSRNLFRDDARAFAADSQAREVMDHALARRFDESMNVDERRFLYMPLQHSENAADQARSVDLYRTLEDDKTFEYTLRHQEIIARFGRFPHRNAVLGRESTAEEVAFLSEPNSSF